MDRVCLASHACWASYLGSRLPSLRLPKLLFSPRPQHPRLLRALAAAATKQPLAPLHESGGEPRPGRQQRRAAHTSGAADDFFASAAKSFASLGLDVQVAGALEAAGFGRPAHVQVREPAFHSCSGSGRMGGTSALLPRISLEE